MIDFGRGLFGVGVELGGNAGALKWPFRMALLSCALSCGSDQTALLGSEEASPGMSGIGGAGISPAGPKTPPESPPKDPSVKTPPGDGEDLPAGETIPDPVSNPDEVPPLPTDPISNPEEAPSTSSDAGVADGGSSELPPITGLLARPFAAAYLNLPPRAAFVSPGWDFEPVFEALSFNNATFMLEAPHTNQILVAEREGRIWAFEKRADVTEKKLVLDLSNQCQGRGDHGLLGFALHPEFGDPESPNQGYIYVHCPYRNPAVIDGPFDANLTTYSRLSRFTIDIQTLEGNLSSELVLIDQFDENTLHLGGALFFRPSDGYLYLTVGDEGVECIRSNNCNRIDNDLYSGVLRIDVDPTVDADSHAIPRQPTTGMTANYTIPNDNPFVGEPNALEEFYALGLRSPHRMTHDPVDDIVWIGDVGASTREELNVLQPGANFQWDSREGFLRLRQSVSTIGVWTDPVIDFTRADFRTIIGGYVYRGAKFPELEGQYIFGDFLSNGIWALDYAYDGTRTDVLSVGRIATAVGGSSSGLTSFGVDSEGELYMLSLGQQRIKSLMFREEGATNLPTELSSAGVFDDLPSLTPSAALIPYDVQNPLWSDGAGKERWISLPQGSSITFSEEGPWAFPPGTVFVKHFELATDEREPAVRRRLETRVLVAAEDGTYYGATYKWNESETSATLLHESQTEELSITQTDGSTRTQAYFFPGPRDCLTCHNPSAGFVLGVRTAQLNGAKQYSAGGEPANQLRTWAEIGMFDRSLTSDEIEALPRLASLDDTTRSIEDRVRSYWDSNCSMCHGVQEGIRAQWDARYRTPLAEQRVVGGSSINNDGRFIIVPGDPEASLLVERDQTTDPNRRMPPLGRTRTDQKYIDLLRAWVAELPAPVTP